MAIINKYIHVFEIGMKTTSVQFCNIPQKLVFNVTLWLGASVCFSLKHFGT